MSEQQVLSSDRGSNAEPVSSLAQTLIEVQAGMALRVVITVFVNATILTVMMALFLPIEFPIIWLLAVMVALFVRTAILSRLPEAKISDKSKLRLLVFAFAISGLTHGAVALFMPHLPPLVSALVLIYVCGMCAATVPGTNGYLPAYSAYLLVCLFPSCLSIMFFTEFGQEKIFQIALLVSFSVLAIILLMQAREAFQVFRHSYEIRFERMKLNSELTDALRTAELANAAKTRFLASASHDLRQPIHALSLFSATLSMLELQPKAKRIADQMDASINAISSQLDVLLDISKLDAGIVDVDIVSVDVAQQLKSLASEFGHLAERKGLELDLRLQEPAYALVDKLLLERALRNLIANAIKYTSRGFVSLRVETEGEQVVIEISDTGFGIPQDKLPLIFDEFFQVDNPERDRSQGLGLGLSIVKRISELIGAKIDVESTRGVGSRFTLTLRGGQQESLPAQALEVVERYGESKAMQLLVVDDEQSVREGMALLLESLGYEVALAASTNEAMQIAEDFTPDIALLDFRLRGGDSAENALKNLREKIDDLPAIIITGDSGAEVERVARVYRATVIQKPVSLALLQKTLHEVLPDDEAL